MRHDHNRLWPPHAQSGFSDGIETIQAVRNYISVGGQMLLRPSGNVPFAETVDHGELEALQ